MKLIYVAVESEQVIPGRRKVGLADLAANPESSNQPQCPLSSSGAYWISGSGAYRISGDYRPKGRWPFPGMTPDMIANFKIAVLGLRFDRIRPSPINPAARPGVSFAALSPSPMPCVDTDLSNP